MVLTRRSFLQQAGAAALGAGAGMVAAPWSAAADDSTARKLKVTECKTLVVNNVPPYSGMKKWLFVQLFTNEGLIGLGERPAGGMRDPKSQIELIHDTCERYVIGQSPFDIEKIWQHAYAGLHDYRHPSLYGIPALAAIEMACWDLIGKATSQPIYNLLGGKVRDRLWGYSYLDHTGILEHPELAGERAAKLLEQGITATKIDPFPPPAPAPTDFPLEDIRKGARVFRAIRDAVGDKLEIGIGTHGQFTTGSAIRVAGILEEYHPMWFEEPVPPENVEEMAQVAASTKIPIATGERLVTVYEFAALLEKRAARIIQLDVGQCGGILEGKKIAGIAEAHYANIAPHMYCGPVAAAAAVQLDTCTPNFFIQEFNTTSLHSEIFVEPIRYEEGHITPPTGPGLGVEFNEKVLKRQLAT